MGIIGRMTNLLRQHLKSTRQTQAEFARKVGVLQATVSKLCGSRPKISADLAVKIEWATGGAVAVESWPPFRPLLHRIPPSPGNARNSFLPVLDDNTNSSDIPPVQKDRYGKDVDVGPAPESAP
jgi:DNA-binding transcriptional regulator YdaS (Cro superfamily)